MVCGILQQRVVDDCDSLGLKEQKFLPTAAHLASAFQQQGCKQRAVTWGAGILDTGRLGCKCRTGIAVLLHKSLCTYHTAICSYLQRLLSVQIARRPCAATTAALRLLRPVAYRDFAPGTKRHIQNAPNTARIPSSCHPVELSRAQKPGRRPWAPAHARREHATARRRIDRAHSAALAPILCRRGEEVTRA